MQAKIAVVTGANRGLGLASCRALSDAGYHVILCARDSEPGVQAVETLQQEKRSVELRVVDVNRAEQVKDLGRYIRENYGRVDVLINNAGINIESRQAGGERSANPLIVSPMTVMETLNTNTLGALRMIQALALMMPEGGRIVNVSSGMGQLSEMDGGWLGYRLSKTALNSLTRVFAKELEERSILVNSVCPGWVRTDLGGEQASRSIEEGIDTIIWLATDPEVTESGAFWRDRAKIDW
ncbi:NAD(P)-dependent dehydrogenase (short-subunit alcohol dehydrogenase family) [Natronospira proteinivora]|uniref:NAD(P)-dependent dehydrogenase (Short-subunit alcohol dehydrogenase family) n=1 Tax=Natronospira proteinivora TaxID=1807133 RepID=A0ABT1G8U9_9GAMM|nr:SDR family oxidoreductase [Natronospira proteinivora]MCP1727753.1 NAD(P)-dependent dehydrogenase (short-subunit alcohol dehydrogenase family) [Natronospira proteinivora]